MLKGFREFVLRGNVVDLAVGVVIGAAFGAVVTSFTKDLLTPAIAAIVGKPDFSGIAMTVNGSKLMVGSFLNALISFLLVAAAVYFFVVVPMNALTKRFAPAAPAAPAPAPSTKKCCECATEIPIDARRCPNCTSQLSSAASA
ncbi:MAG TPA: large conductance mechanosensitive channel protein MscL [candidate division Zixibacteria bacterium]|nr:large conductance mechanosensitive channel protein MscL [candidate division Zixibacteria bacterium]